jgi:uncharacterized protein
VIQDPISAEQKQVVIWQADFAPGLEILDITSWSTDSIHVDSIVQGVADGQVFKMRYRFFLNLDWTVISVHFTELPGFDEVDLYPKEATHSWSTPSFLYELDDLKDCPLIDISFTPFTNTLAIKQLKLEVGQSADVRALYVESPTLGFKVSEQRYERLSEFEYRYTSLGSGFTAVITVDQDDLVVSYPGLFTRRFL